MPTKKVCKLQEKFNKRMESRKMKPEVKEKLSSFSKRSGFIDRTRYSSTPLPHGKNPVSCYKEGKLVKNFRSLSDAGRWIGEKRNTVDCTYYRKQIRKCLNFELDTFMGYEWK